MVSKKLRDKLMVVALVPLSSAVKGPMGQARGIGVLR
jgi:hypothetical protein